MQQIGYIGLGKMGLNMVTRLSRSQLYEINVYNRTKDVYKNLDNIENIVLTQNFPELVDNLNGRRVIWLMITNSAVDEVINELLQLLREKDVLIDGGNSNYKDTLRRYNLLKSKGIIYIDCGVSGGPIGALNGACLMIGGDEIEINSLDNLWKAISDGSSYKYLGTSGAGHYAKMIHNGIEYGMMQSIAEGFNILKNSPYKFNLQNVAELYNQNSVIQSRLIGWIHNAYKTYGDNLNEYTGQVGHTGEGEWTIDEAKHLQLPVPVIQESFNFRVNSDKNPSYIGKIVTALREQFGGKRNIR